MSSCYCNYIDLAETKRYCVCISFAMSAHKEQFRIRNQPLVFGPSKQIEIINEPMLKLARGRGTQFISPYVPWLILEKGNRYLPIAPKPKHQKVKPADPSSTQQLEYWIFSDVDPTKYGKFEVLIHSQIMTIPGLVKNMWIKTRPKTQADKSSKET